MPERRPWTQSQDKILKHLKQQLGLKKWSQIAKTMQRQYSIRGKTGKQCRERYLPTLSRYHNHLDDSIILSQWAKDEERILVERHEVVGNKWSQIAQALPGRSDNCVKNHFYSRLRKAVRRLNKIINESYRKQYREIKMPTMYKIVEVTELRFKSSGKIGEEVVQMSRGLKNQLLMMEEESEGSGSGGEDKWRGLIGRVHYFQERHRKSTRRGKEHKGSTETNYSNAPEPQQSKQDGQAGLKEEVPFYEIFRKVCEEIMLQPQ